MQVPDLIILDLSMPGMDGFAVIRENCALVHRARSILLSVRGSDADKVTALGPGRDDYLTKPFSTTELLARIRALLQLRPPCAARRHRSLSPANWKSTWPTPG